MSASRTYDVRDDPDKKITYSKSDGDLFHDGWYINITEEDESGMRVYALPFQSEENRDEAWRALQEDPEPNESFAEAGA